VARIAKKDDDVMVAGAAPKPGAPDESTPEQVEMPLPSDLRTSFEGGLFLLALLAALYAAREIVLPVVLAFFLRLVLQPAVRLLERVRVPAVISALLLIFLSLGAVVTLGMALYGAAASWAAKLPEGLPHLQEHLRFLRAPIEAVHNFLQLAEDYVRGQSQPAGSGTQQATDGSAWIILFAGSRAFVAGLLEGVLVLFFFLIAGDTFLRRLVEILPRFGDKRQAVEMLLDIEQDISAYLVTVTIMNVCVGLATALVMWLCGVGDPILWGAVAFLLNYVPILGPMLGIVTFALAGLLTSQTFWLALLPAVLIWQFILLKERRLRPCCYRGVLRSIPCSSSCRSSFGIGCGACWAQFWPYRCLQ
jgi:predicted PurR-regulated permease PerM